MRCKLICCEIFVREACLAIAMSPHTVDPEFTPKGAHDMSDYLREILQASIDKAEEKGCYDAILLGIGLCGNGIVGLKSKTIPMVVPRAHDCCTLTLGSREKFMEYFKDDLSAEWSSAGYMERGETYTKETDTTKMLGLDMEYEVFVQQYGEDNAKYLWEMLHPAPVSDEMIFIDVPETSHLNALEKLKVEADKKGKRIRILPGDMRMIRDLICGNWDDKDFLIVPPGKEIKGVYDQDRVITYE